MDSAQKENVFSTVKTISDHLGYAWNCSGTLRGLQKHTRECEPLLRGHGHFIAIIHRALWEMLFLKLNHCCDKTRGTIGFPKLFNQIRKYCKGDELVVQMVEQQERRLHTLDVQKKVKKWRDQAVAHHTIINQTAFDAFSKENRVSLDEIEQLIRQLNEILRIFITIPFCGQTLPDVSIFDYYAREGVDQLVASLKKAAEYSELTP